MRRSARAAAILVLAAAPAVSPVSAATQPDPAAFDAVLAARARNGGFDYRGADGQDRKRLAAYLANLGDANPASMDRRRAGRPSGSTPTTRRRSRPCSTSTP